MKITIDTGALDDERGLMGRAYIAAVIGPARRPFGRLQSFTLPPGQPVQIATNNTADRVLYCTAAVLLNPGGVGSVRFSKDAGAAAGDIVATGPNTRPFILYPGDMLWATMDGLNNPIQVTATTEAF